MPTKRKIPQKSDVNGSLRNGAKSSASNKAAKTEVLDDDEDMFGVDDMDLLDAAEEMEAQDVDSNSNDTPELDSATTVSYTEWERPPVPPTFHESTSSLSFQQLDMDHYIGKPLHGMPGATVGPVPIIRYDYY